MDVRSKSLLLGTVAVVGLMADAGAALSNPLHQRQFDQPPVVVFASTLADRVEAMDAVLGDEIVALAPEVIRAIERG